ncbi:hypothetical protein SAMN05444392_105220 [Seinonella peptonophila]|uniref:Uncharacterized protein n=1 Tax=Seinonella peptonophila TaxID=112248 RepID=A0A1M4XWH4_9BACL|nr:hypothetical protein SAMN05444392_105220 [Seinonella peptonophila]
MIGGKAPFRAQLSGMAAVAAFSFRANCSRRMPEEASFARPRRLTERGQTHIFASPGRSRHREPRSRAGHMTLSAN